MDQPDGIVAVESVPESRVLIIMTGGTICMRRSPIGLIPARGFLEELLAPRSELNDGLEHDPIGVKENDQDHAPRLYRSLRTPITNYGKQIR